MGALDMQVTDQHAKVERAIAARRYLIDALEAWNIDTPLHLSYNVRHALCELDAALDGRIAKMAQPARLVVL